MELFDLTGKIAAVTGSSRGIGKAIAIGLAEAGADVACVQRSASDKDTQQEILKLGRRAEIFECDLHDNERIAQAVGEIIGNMGKIDILVNNAGIQRNGPAESLALADWDEVVQVDLTSMFVMCREAGKYMLEHGGGKIINIASLASFIGITGDIAAYAATKSGVMGLTKALSCSWSKHGINVNAIAPGYIITDLNVGMDEDTHFVNHIPAKHMGLPSDMAGAAVFLASSASDYVCGHTLVVDGGVLAASTHDNI
jgi:2-deoxy-D-gluconate 3-dehydrogenase